MALLLLGSLSTALWLSEGATRGLPAALGTVPALLGVACCVALTSANIGLRWFRWHFLVRRLSRSLTTRDSLAAYLATLPALMTPFLVGELVRVLLLRRRVQVPPVFLVRIWFAERVLDAAVLLAFYLLCWNGIWGTAAVAAVLGSTPLLYHLTLPRSAVGSRTQLSLIALAITAAAWALPIVALVVTLRLLGTQAALPVAAQAFSAGTLFGGITGLPLGVLVTGSTMINELITLGVDPERGILAVLLYRAGTAWFAVGLGVVALLRFRRRLYALVRGSAAEHFDEIASEYEDEIPAHVRERLLSRKVAFIQGQLHARGIPRDAKGLDLGCGQGWYFLEFVRLGHHMDGLDYSGKQIERAKVNLARSGLSAQSTSLRQGDAMALPYADNTFDFAYSINALHHILAPEGQAQALREVVRVLKPGGVFVLHEMNTYNPLFRLYMGYLFPLLKKIDEGNEIWLLPHKLEPIPGARWLPDKAYFTFMPDFVPSAVQRWFAGIERWLETSRFRRLSAHYQACLAKDSTD